MPPAWRTHLDAHKKDAVETLKELLRIPSISADPARRADCKIAAEWVLARLKAAGFEGKLEVVDKGQPIVTAKKILDEDAPTVTYYGHYDVQPADPLELWTTSPFEPTVEKGTIRARGATDDKGQVVANLVALEAFAATDAFPCNVQVLIEGEEESGGESLPKFIGKNEKKWTCDAVVVSDTALWDEKHPAVVNGLRGIVTMEFVVRASTRDLHSGIYGGAVINPAEALARAIATLKDDKGRITVPGFYDEVRELTKPERDAMAKVPHSDKEFMAEIGAKGLAGEAGRSTLERIWTRPTLEVNGLSGGYAGPGFKTVLPAQAVAKISCRLVPDMDPDKIAKDVVDAVKKALPREVTVEAQVLGKAPAWYVPPTDPVLTTAATCLEEAFGGSAVFIREGGSIPVVPHLGKLGPVALMGYGMHDERLHAPDEFFRLDHFHKGSVAFGTFLTRMAQR